MMVDNAEQMMVQPLDVQVMFDTRSSGPWWQVAEVASSPEHVQTGRYVVE